MNNKKTTLSISSYSNSNLINISAPLNVSYLIDEKYTMDNTNGYTYPNFAIVHKNAYSVISKIDDILKNTSDAPVYTQ
jgi:hypothetical protein